MHYKNGREAKESDFIIAPVYLGSSMTNGAGRLSKINVKVDSCNGIVTFPVMGGVEHCAVNIKDCYHVEDALAAIEPKINQS